MIKVPYNKSALKQALGAIMQLKTNHDAHEEHKRDIVRKAESKGRGPHSPVTANELWEADRKHEEAQQSVLNLFAKHLESFYTSVVAAYPNPKNLDADARNDLWLLDHGYITTPGELRAMWMRNKSPLNPVVLKACERYAAHPDRKWPEFKFETNADQLMRAYDCAIFYAGKVSKHPDGPEAQKIGDLLDPDDFINHALEVNE